MLGVIKNADLFNAIDRRQKNSKFKKYLFLENDLENLPNQSVRRVP